MGVLDAAGLRRRGSNTKPKQEWSCGKCFSCGVVRPLLSWESMPDGRRYIKARCPKCDVFLAVAPQTPENVGKADAAGRSWVGAPWWIWALLCGALLPVAGTLLRPWSAALGIAGVALGLTALAAGLYGLVGHCRPKGRGGPPATPGKATTVVDNSVKT